jgi:iron complex outermembrane receptor protein
MSRIHLHAFIVAGGLGAACLPLSLLPATAQAAALDEPVEFDIPSQPLEAALLRFSQQAGIQLMTSSDELPSTLSSAISGRQIVSVALEKLLEGTGLTFSVVKDGTIAVRSEGARATSSATVAAHGTMRLAQADTRGSAESVPAASEYAQSGSESVSSLDTVTVTGSRMKKQLSDVTTSISVVNEKALAEQFSISTDVLEALNVTVPGLNVSQGYNRQGCNMNVRGRQANFQINGIPVNQDLRESNCNAMYQVSPFALERIEVLRGASALYGAGAPGGTINMITRRASSDELEIDGTFRLSANPRGISDTQNYDAYLGAGQSFEGWDYYAGLAYQDVGAARTPRDSFVPQEERTSWSFNGSLGRQIGEDGELRLTGTFYREERGQEYATDWTTTRGTYNNIVPIDDHPYKHEGYDQLLTLVAAYEQAGVLGHDLAISAYLQSQEYLQRMNEYGAGWGNFFFASDTENDRIGLRSTLAREFAVGANTLELEYGVDYVSNTFFRPTVDPENGGVITGWVSPEITFETTSGFFQSDYVVGRLRFSGGARYESYEGEVGDRGYDPALPNASGPGKTDSTNLWLLNLGAVYDLTETLQVYGGFSQGAEISQLARAVRGQPDPSVVSPEPATSDQFEIGLRGRSGNVEYSAAAFHSKSDKASLLQADPSCAGQPGLCPLIPLRAPQRFHGLEGTLDWKTSDRWTTGAIFTLQRGEVFDEGLGRYVEYSAEHVSPLRLTGYAAFSPTEKMNVRLQGTYYGAADYYSAGEQALGYFNTESLFLMDLSSAFGVGPGELTVSVANLLDKEYVNYANQASFDFFYYMEEGRRVSLGYRVRF